MRIYNWFYKLGAPLISDSKYNELYTTLRNEHPDSPIVLQTWSEQRKPIAELRVAGLLEKAEILEKSRVSKSGSPFFMPVENIEMRDKFLRICLEHFDSTTVLKSIDTIENEMASRQWVGEVKQRAPSISLNLSLKADGFNVSHFYYRGYYVGSFTRGRAGDSDDVTIALSRVVPMKLPTDAQFVRIRSEAVMRKSALEEFRVKDPSRDWKSERNSMSTLLMNDIGEEFHREIIPLAFRADGLEFESQDAEFNWLEDVGFPVPYNITFSFEDSNQLLTEIQQLSQQEFIYKTDGCVVTVNDRRVYNSFDTSAKYDFGQRAFRMYEWASKIYISVITGFSTDENYNSKRISVTADILPTRVTNGSVISNLDVDNLSRVEEAGIKRGSLVAFWIRADSCVDWLVRETVSLNRIISSKGKVPAHLVAPLQKLQRAAAEKKNFIS